MQTIVLDKIPEEKRKRVILAGFRCFAQDGYEKTAISEIAKEANISKPLLFHYFGTKKDLYCFLFSFALNELAKGIVEGTCDFFESLRLGIKQKLEVIKTFPYMTEFLTSAVVSDKSEFMDELRMLIKNTNDAATAMLFKNIDRSKFNQGVTFEKAMNIVTWIADGCLRGGYKKTVEDLAVEIDAYFDIIKPILCRQ
jgi:AcrR family transcriptional regulator